MVQFFSGKKSLSGLVRLKDLKTRKKLQEMLM